MIRWVPIEAVLNVHSELIHLFGGCPGVRDRNLLESALARSKQHQKYKKADLFEMTAATTYSLVKNHPFIDGNKRTALLFAFIFLQLNGFTLNATEQEAVLVLNAVADNTTNESNLAHWLRKNSLPAQAY